MTRLGLLIAACGSLLVAPGGLAAAWAAAPPVPPPAPNRAAGSSGAIQASNGSGGLSAAATTGAGAVALATSPHLITPNLDTPSAINLTNATGLPLASGVAGALPLANGGLGAASTLTTGNVLPGFATNPVTTGLIAEYPMTEGSGTVVHDISGNGNTANFGSGSNAPTWTSYGIAFGGPTGQVPTTTWVQTPVKTFGTVVMHACAGPGPQTTGISTTGTPYAFYPALLATPWTTDGLWVINTVSSSIQQHGAFYPSTVSISNTTYHTTPSASIAAPCGVYALSLGSSDHEYWNGQEISYATQGTSSSYATTTSTGYMLGDGNQNSGNAFKGYIDYVAFYSSALTTAQVAQVSAFEAYQVQNRVGYPVVQPTNAGPYQAVFSGDSVTAGLDSSAIWTTQAYVNLNNTYAFQNWGVTGQFARTMSATEPLRACAGVSSISGHNVYHLWAGSNDVAIGGFNAAQTWQAIQATAKEARACGFDKIIIATMVARGAPSNQDTNKNALNALIRANWRSVADALDDLAAIPGLGANGAYANPTYTCFYSDQTHLKGMGTGTTCYNGTDGYGAVAWNAGRVINILDGATDDNPTVTTSNAYTEAVADNVLQDTPSAAATVTLIDATGLTGQARKIINLSASYSITVSGTGASGSTVLGNTVVAPNTTAVFRDELISATGGGNAWVRQQ